MPLEVGSVDRRALIFLFCGVALILILRFGVYGGGSQTVVAATDSIPMAEKRLARLRVLAATVHVVVQPLQHIVARGRWRPAGKRPRRPGTRRRSRSRRRRPARLPRAERW